MTGPETGTARDTGDATALPHAWATRETEARRGDAAADLRLFIPHQFRQILHLRFTTDDLTRLPTRADLRCANP